MLAATMAKFCISFRAKTTNAMPSEMLRACVTRGENLGYESPNNGTAHAIIF